MKKRSEIPACDRWQIDRMYPGIPEWERDLTDAKKEIQSIQKFRGRLKEGSSIVQKLFDEKYRIERKLNTIYVYAHLRHDENTEDAVCKGMVDRGLFLYEEYGRLSSFITPELKALDSERLKSYLESRTLAEYRFCLEEIVRYKPHILGSSEEELLALLGPAFRVASQTFDVLHDGDMKFPDLEMPDGTKKEVSHGLYHVHLTSLNREVRKRAYQSYLGQFEKLKLTYASLLQGCVLNHSALAKARNFSSSLKSSLFSDNIPQEVYSNLIRSVRNHIEINHQYFDLKKKFLNLDDIHVYDTHVPLTNNYQKTFEFDEAVECIADALRPLGDEYVKEMRAGIRRRWVDKYESLNKRSGAYSSGCYDSDPYILMNWDGTIRSVFTLAHELGHSMHKLYSTRHQPPQYAQYSIFIAEIASTVNEQLLAHWFMKHADQHEEKIYLLSQQMDDLRATLVRQTMFAEFEQFIHEAVEKGRPLDVEFLKNSYEQLNKDYFGPRVVLDQEIRMEWARIPHFYYNFYVYKYATGISAAIDISGRLIKDDTSSCEAYIRMLGLGASQHSLDILLAVGVDLLSPAPIECAMTHFQGLIHKLQELYQPLSTS
ncbi:oligoendopeptidase F [PVC group bacterium]|nr:oligoendopeptidase F [PVC group bacterium]